MKSITKYIKEGFFKNLDIGIPEKIRHIFDDLCRHKYSSQLYGWSGLKSSDMAAKSGFTIRNVNYYITLKYDTCQIIIHNGEHKTNKNDMIINMLEFPEFVVNLAKNKVLGISITDRNTLSAYSYGIHKRKYDPNISIINFRCEGEKYYQIKYDRAKHVATEME